MDFSIVRQVAIVPADTYVYNLNGNGEIESVTKTKDYTLPGAHATELTFYSQDGMISQISTAQQPPSAISKKGFKSNSVYEFTVIDHRSGLGGKLDIRYVL